MAGHNKWSKIKRQKAIYDEKKSLSLAKHTKSIIVAVKVGASPDPKYNFKLKQAIDKAKLEGVPKSNIERAIAKGAGSDQDSNFNEVIYEGYLSNGVAVMVFTATDNTNRTYADIRNIFNKAGGSLGKPGCVAYNFDLEKNEAYNKVEISDEKILEGIYKAFSALEENEDVINFISNLA